MKLISTKGGFHPFESISFDFLFKCTELLTEYLLAFDIEINPSSRFGRYQKILKLKINKTIAKEADLLLLEQAFYDLTQIALIINEIKNTDIDSSLGGKLELLLKDSVSIEIGKNSMGRDTQFELFLLCCLNCTDIKVKLGTPPEPDIVGNIKGWRIGIEAKRIKSIPKMKTRFKKANDQLRKMKDGGIIATDLSYSFQLTPVKTVNNPQEALIDLEQRLYRLMFNRLENVRKYVKPNRSFCWIGYTQKMYHSLDNGLFVIYQWKSFNICNENDLRWKKIHSIFHQIGNSMKNLEKRLN